MANAVEEDSGVYQCFAYNPAGNDSSAAVVRVLSELICGVWYRVYTKQDVLLHDHYTPHTSPCVCTMDTGLAPTTEFVIVQYTMCAVSLLVTFLSLPSFPSFPLPPFLPLPPPSTAVPANFIGDGLVPNQVAFMGQPFVMSCNARGI